MNKRMQWYKDHELPRGARVIQSRSVIVRYESPDHPLMNSIPIYEDEYLVDTYELNETLEESI